MNKQFKDSVDRVVKEALKLTNTKDCLKFMQDWASKLTDEQKNEIRNYWCEEHPPDVEALIEKLAPLFGQMDMGKKVI